MKLQKSLFILVILLVSLQVCFGQEKPEAILIDELEGFPCDEFLARTDAFFISLQNNPDSQGYAVISGKNEELQKKVGYELFIKGAMAFRNFDRSRIIQIRGAETGNFKIQFWRVPAGAEKPDFKETAWNFVFPPQTKPFVFSWEGVAGVCPETPFETIYAEYLNANPEARGHIVIYAKSLKKYNKLKNEARKILKDISLNRLRFFHIKKEYSDNYANVEYWLVPQKVK